MVSGSNEQDVLCCFQLQDIVDVAHLKGAGQILYIHRGDAVRRKYLVYVYSGHAEVGQKGFSYILVIKKDVDSVNPAV